MKNKPEKKPEYNGTAYTISIARANIIAMVLIIPLSVLYALPYYLVWKINLFKAITHIPFFLILLSIPLGIVTHELLHGITWFFFTKKGFRSIRFGIKYEYFTPYCHCTESLKVWQYILGSIMPLLFMGIVPGIWALISGNTLVICFAMFFTWTAGGDLQAVWMLRKFKANQLIYDHPDQLGFIIRDE